ncbi:hypothetical protein QTH87_02250 [Variovorax sp. J22P168]|uniref:hypothetical protein n=1 Tax=Variovorax jilinensis TaxID=3053513 RepID=UPI0025756355|nr:hypothetical protein [Variovorax sp. J22P168]MDM0011249.1 hypothetical protein [Variovorax sp. J22P168]
MTHAYLNGIAYTLGEEERSHETASGFGTLNVPNRPALWGWGHYRQASGSVFDLMITAARRSLEAARVKPGEIDIVIFCHATVPRYEGPPSAAASRMLVELGLGRAFPVSAGLNGCAALLCGVVMADGLVAAGRARRVLVVAGDVHPADQNRFHRYAIFSDAACACVVSSTATEGAFELLAAASAVDASAMAADAGFSSELAAQVNQAMLVDAGIPASDVAKVFCNNVFLPITMLKESEGGFDEGQLFTDNVKRIAHCYSADALINLADHASAGGVRRGGHYVVAADSPGLRTGVLLKAV